MRPQRHVLADLPAHHRGVPPLGDGARVLTDPAARALVQAEIERVAAIEANLAVVATSYSSVNVQAALSALSSLGAAPADTLQAQLDRTVNLARGLLGSLFTSGKTARDSFCVAHR